mgnify:CR=1 FL=1
MLNITEKTAAIVDALEDIKALDIEVIDTSKLSPLFERMVIASAQSTRQTKALADHVEEKLKALGETILSVEGAKDNKVAAIRFEGDDVEERRIVLKFARLQVVK